MNVLKLLILAAVVAGASEARAGVVVWDLAGHPGDEASAAATSVPSGMTASDITRGSGILAAPGADSINSSNWEDQSIPNPDQYYEFSVGGGSPFSLASLDYTDNRSITGPFGMRVFYSIDGFSSSTMIDSYTLLEATNTRHSIDLSTIAELQGVTGTVAFRIFAFGSSFLVGTYGLGTDPFSADNTLPANVMLTTASITAAPEPGTISLAVLGMPILLWASRRSSRAREA